MTIFGTGLSGLQAATNDLGIVGNNIANSSTVGFKSSRALFADVYANSFFGSTNVIGDGVNMIGVQQSFGQGNISFTNNSLDLAINGSGFFILSDNGSSVYTRAGAFSIDNNGFIVNSLNQNLTGLLAENGQLGSVTGNLQLNTANITPQATTTVSEGANLYANSTPPTVAWSGGATPAGDTYNNVTSSTIYDSLGNSHVLSMYFIRGDASAPAGDPNASSPAGTQNQWYVAFQIDNQNVPANVGTTNSANLYRVNFNSDGSFTNVADTTNTPIANNLIPLTTNLTNGANPLNFTVDLSNCTQFGSPFAVQSSTQNGFTTGQLNSVSIDQDGVLFGLYTNGQSQIMGQVQLANFPNLNGLQPLGNTTWGETASSGQALVGNPGTASLGLIQSGALEESNVDLTNELVNLITAQRYFQANAQTISAGDTITQTIINIG
ncbi:flagellar hook protein FlgE [Legionella micdadei]|uniref:Flagellar hook protein FlgE n=1 Tax=Legionella micdadei TaxID=451 RepID=A0A098GDQ9_LEGMI|nr:flagellar hook protein FlgE [Legionella micdadei]ARG97789.1 flagellar hook protein FlgE [Legionella micdadei]KTD28501.1 flagellar hook protein FlgE [Legionella micdadei]NSL18730.1 flagellar hook protein FlgE [Legionella micdadei]CEG60609.1 Flagellar hook protein FlgE [Legionella micdadei]SCX83233.1 flagellar hook protein FlgE [Legionella micdadei]